MLRFCFKVKEISLKLQLFTSDILLIPVFVCDSLPICIPLGQIGGACVA